MDFPSGEHRRGDQLVADEELACDAVVIGSGAGGAAAAWELSRRGLTVLVLEEGKKWEPAELSTKQSWALRNLYAERGTSVAQGNIFLPMPRGRAVGGTTLINSAICFRAPTDVLTTWRDAYGVDWADPTTMAPVYDEVERTIGVMKTHPAIAKAHNLIFKKGADAVGLVGDFISRNAPACVGCGVCQLGCPVGGKGSVDRNLIPLALAQGASLFSCTAAEAIILEGGRAVGVEARGVHPFTEVRGRRLRVRARRVFLAAGAVGSPVLLQRQGVAGSNGQLGENLHVHCASGVCARFEHIVDAWHGVTQGYYALLPGESAVLETFSATPDIYAVQYEALSQPVAQLRHLASCGVMVGDVSKGRVRPGAGPGRSELSYHLLREDVRVIKTGLREISRAYFAAGALEVSFGIAGVPPLRSMREVEVLLDQPIPVDRLGVYASHPMSTCRMSSDPTQGVVRPDGSAWEVENLAVCDASVFPTALGVNPQVTVMASAVLIARRQLEAG